MLYLILRSPSMARRVIERAPDRFSLAGHSRGGRIAMEIMRQAPERIEWLVLLDTGVVRVRRASANAVRRSWLHRPDASRILEAIRRPTLVLCGRQDSQCPRSHHEKLAWKIKGAKPVLIEDSGQIGTVEHPVPFLMRYESGWLETRTTYNVYYVKSHRWQASRSPDATAVHASRDAPRLISWTSSTDLLPAFTAVAVIRNARRNCS